MTEPEIFGRYQLLTLAGEGGMAHVHLARQLGPDGVVKPCVLKRIAPELSRDPNLRRMFLEEARVSALLNHPNVVQTFDYGEVDGTPYMAMELVDGVSLAKLCRVLAEKRRWFSLGAAVDLCICLVKALDYAHGLTDLEGRPMNVVHRDVSPQNVLLSRAGAVKLSDFGIARHEARLQVTVAHTAKGKPGYMAPEQAMGGAIDPRADLFSVGVMLAELVSARRVLSEGGDVHGVLAIQPRVAKLCGYRKDAPPEISALAQRLVALEPDARPASAAETLAQLTAIRRQLPPEQPIDEFLRKVFNAFVGQQTIDAPPPPTGDESFDKTWIQQAAATGTAIVYQEGWPSEFLDSGRSAPALRLPSSDVPSLKLPDGASSVVSAPTAPAGPTAPPDTPEQDIALVPNSATMESMQYFGAQTSKDAQKRAVPPISVPQIERMFDPDAEAEPAPKSGAKPVLPGRPVSPPKPRKPIPTVVWLGVGAFVVVLLAVGVIAMVGGESAPKPAAQVVYGSILVTSQPPGATIYIDERKMPKPTPYTVERLPLDRPLRVRVEKTNHAVRPKFAEVRIPAGTKHTKAVFDLAPGRVFEVRSTPPDAVVAVNGTRLAEPTPVSLAPIALGETATITLELDEHLPTRVVIASTTETASVVDVTLPPAQRLDVTSEPPGATLKLDGEAIGETPAYDLLLPKQGRFTLTMNKHGFKRWRKRFRADRLGAEPIVAELTPLPILRMKLSREERAQAKKLDAEIARLKRQTRQIDRGLERARRLLVKVEESNTVFVGDLAEAQRRVDVLSEKQATNADALLDAEGRMEAFRERVLLRAGE
ncbi:MAG: protein kinase [Deltaproteobacteria bacterium]